jgi:hypothetical protein
MHPMLLVLALQVTRWPAETPLEVDGRLDEPFWQTIPPASEFYQVLPQSGVPAPYSTHVRVALDERHFYIGVEMQDPPGSERQSNASRRDHIPASDDTLTLILDPLGTRAFGQVFQVNPDCSINDGLYKEATLSTDLSSDFFHTVGCQQNENGWTVEFKIPLKELRFDQSSVRPWNMLVQRSLVRDQRRTLANAPLPRDPLCLLCLAPSLLITEGLPDQNFLRATPYALARHTDKDAFSSGVDIKYRVDSSSFLDATVNPDFSQVNLDEPQLSANTRFAVSYPENRPFFLEGSDILETPLKVIATRSISQPSWGLKYTQRSETRDTMIISGDDRSDNRILIPGPYGSRYQTLQARQKYLIGTTQWKGSGIQLGLTYTHRSYEDLGWNQTLGLSSTHFFTNEDSLRWQAILSGSYDRWNVEDYSLNLDGAEFLLFQHKGERWHSSMEMKSIGAGFRTDLGFNPRNHYRLGILTNTWHQNLGETHLAWYLRMSRKNEFSAKPIQIQNAPGITLTGWLGAELTLETRPGTRERIREDSVLHRYQQHYLSLGFYPGSVLTWVQCDLSWGERLDVTEDQVRPGRAESCAARLALGKKVEWNTSFSQERLHEQHGLGNHSPILINHVVRHLVVLPLKAHFSLRYIRQEERAQRIGTAMERGKTDSWNVSYENPETVTLHAGATIARDAGGAQRDYYLKLSANLP